MTDDETDYRTLADHIIDLTNPADDDIAEVAIMLDAVTRLTDVVARGLPCTCPASEMGDDYAASDACPRCRALGRFANKVLDR